jgi:hypothetical protein
VAYRELLHLRRRHAEAAPARPVGLADDADHGVGAGEKRLEDRAREAGVPMNTVRQLGRFVVR